MSLASVWECIKDGAATGFSFIQLALVEQCLCKGQSSNRRIGLLAQSAAKTLISRCKQALTVKGLAKPQQRFEMLGIDRQCLII